MNLLMDSHGTEHYTSEAQRIRVITERWAADNLYCPCCGWPNILKYENNRPAADFFCPKCGEQYELKSKSGVIGRKVSDGAYRTMILRIQSLSNPNYFFLQYKKAELRVDSLILVPRYFLLPDYIEKRPPLSDSARRAGWTGCNILYREIPPEGRIPMVRDGEAVPSNTVITSVHRTSFIASHDLNARG